MIVEFRELSRTGVAEQQLKVSAAISHVPGHFRPGSTRIPPCLAQLFDSVIPCGDPAGVVTGAMAAAVTCTVG
jgi:hypothetical protein